MDICELQKQIQVIMSQNAEFENCYRKYEAIVLANNHNLVDIDTEKIKSNYVADASAMILITGLLVKKFCLSADGCRDLIDIIDNEELISKLINYDKIDFENFDKGNFEKATSIIGLFEDMQDISSKKMFGQYYTPKKLVEESLYVTEIDYEKIDELKIVDPACGAGAFLTCILEKIANKGYEKFLSVVENNIFGYDINPFAVMLTKFNILAVFFDKFKSISISKFKSVLGNIKLKNTIVVEDLNEYDYIIGNPPYFKIKNETILEYENYKEVLNGQTNMYVLFFVWSIKHCKTNGRITLIIPQSMRNGKYFTKLRQQITQLQIKDVIFVDNKNRSKIFKSAEQAIWVIHLKNTPATPNELVNVHIIENEKMQPFKTFSCNQDDMFNVDAVLLTRDIKAIEIYKRIKQSFSSFVEVESDLIFGNGLFVWNQNKNYLTSSAENSYPIIYANYISQQGFDFQPQSNDSDVGQRKPYCKQTDKTSRFLLSGKRLIIKRTSGMEKFKRIHSCVITEEFTRTYPFYFMENHVNMLYIRNNKQQQVNERKIKYINAFLNSSIANFLFSVSSGHTQVSAQDLNNLPYTYCNADKIIKLLEDNSENIIEIERIFYENFSCAEEEIITIKKYIEDKQK